MKYNNLDYLNSFQRELRNRNYSSNTYNIYSIMLKKFLDFKYSVKIYSEKDTISIFLDKIISIEQKRLAYQSIKAFYEFILNKECPYKLTKFRGKKRLPIILTKDEIHKILKSIKNEKHKLIISFLYGSGLRLSEVIKIKISDLDFDSLTLYIKNSKFNKDRKTIFSEKLVNSLQKIIQTKHANDYLFTTISNNKYNKRTVQQIFSKALKESKIFKKATCHTLRHSFATHLLLDGIDVRSIKNLLGHKSIKTTMIYLHLTDSLKSKIKSPL